MPELTLSAIDQQVLRQATLPALAPLSDKRLGAIARRTALPVSQVEGALQRLAAMTPPPVRRIVDPRLGEFWVGT